MQQFSFFLYCFVLSSFRKRSKTEVFGSKKLVSATETNLSAIVRHQIW